MEEFSANLGYRNARILEERKFWKGQGGPGTYEITDYLYTRQTSSCKTDVMGGALEKFHSFIKHDNPPPGKTFFSTYIFISRGSYFQSFVVLKSSITYEGIHQTLI